MYCACGLQASVLGNRAAARMDRPCQCGILKPRNLMGGVPAIRDYLSGSKPRMRGFEPVWWISCSRFKHCAMVLVLSAIGLIRKGHLRDARLRPVTPKIFVLWPASSSLTFSRSRSVTSRRNREFSS
jgi:hypothetical protein